MDAAPGVWAPGLAFALVMVGYGELLRRGSQGDWTPRPAVGYLALAWRGFICLSVGVAIVLPLIIAAAGQTPPRLTGYGVLIATMAALALPLIMLGTYCATGPVSLTACGRSAPCSSGTRWPPSPRS